MAEGFSKSSLPTRICDGKVYLYLPLTACRNDRFYPAHSLSWYRFIGRILGKAMYEGILVDMAFAGFLATVCFRFQDACFLDGLTS